MKNDDFYEVVSLHSVTDNFVLNKFPNGDDIWLEIYHHDNDKKSTSWDNDLFILNAHKILEKYVKFNKIEVDDVNDFNQILQDVCKEDLEELYEMISYAIKLEYFNNVETEVETNWFKKIYEAKIIFRFDIEFYDFLKFCDEHGLRRLDKEYYIKHINHNNSFFRVFDNKQVILTDDKRIDGNLIYWWDLKKQLNLNK